MLIQHRENAAIIKFKSCLLMLKMLILMGQLLFIFKYEKKFLSNPAELDYHSMKNVKKLT